MYKEEILDLKQNTPLYMLALDMGISETSLRRYLDSKPLGEKTISKIERYVELNYVPKPSLETELNHLLRQYGYKIVNFNEDNALNSVEIYAIKA